MSVDGAQVDLTNERLPQKGLFSDQDRPNFAELETTFWRNLELDGNLQNVRIADAAAIAKMTAKAEKAKAKKRKRQKNKDSPLENPKKRKKLNKTQNGRRRQRSDGDDSTQPKKKSGSKSPRAAVPKNGFKKESFKKESADEAAQPSPEPFGVEVPGINPDSFDEWLDKSKQHWDSIRTDPKRAKRERRRFTPSPPRRAYKRKDTPDDLVPRKRGRPRKPRDEWGDLLDSDPCYSDQSFASADDDSHEEDSGNWFCEDGLNLVVEQMRLCIDQYGDACTIAQVAGKYYHLFKTSFKKDWDIERLPELRGIKAFSDNFEIDGDLKSTSSCLIKIKPGSRKYNSAMSPERVIRTFNATGMGTPIKPPAPKVYRRRKKRWERDEATPMSEVLGRPATEFESEGASDEEELVITYPDPRTDGFCRYCMLEASDPVDLVKCPKCPHCWHTKCMTAVSEQDKPDWNVAEMLQTSFCCGNFGARCTPRLTHKVHPFAPGSTCNYCGHKDLKAYQLVESACGLGYVCPKCSEQERTHGNLLERPREFMKFPPVVDKPDEERKFSQIIIGWHERCMLHFGPTTNEHNELPLRLLAVIDMLRMEDYVNECAIIPRRKATNQEVMAGGIHSRNYIKFLEKMTRQSEKENKADWFWLDSSKNTYLNRNTLESALWSAGITIDIMDQVWLGKRQSGFAFCRPPGHHNRTSEEIERENSRMGAPTQCGGFCVLNETASAIHLLRQKYNDDFYDKHNRDMRIAIVDIDAHHGDGCEKIFFKDAEVLTYSQHRYDVDFYPHPKGNYTEIGDRKARGLNVNVTMSMGHGDAEALYAIETMCLPILTEFQPDLIVVAAGFDAVKGDIAAMKMKTPCFGHIVMRLMGVQPKIMCTLQGGYEAPQVGAGCKYVMQALCGQVSEFMSAEELATKPDPEFVKTIETIKRVHRRYWNCLAISSPI